jgi:putative tricarboxylic transport membrane protein
MVQSPAWRDALARYRWLDRYQAGDPFAQYVEAEEARVRRILRQLGTDGDDAAGTFVSGGPYPIFVLAGLALFAIASTIGGRRSAREVPGRPQTGWRPIVLVASGLVLQVLLAERVGFIAASAALFWLTARAFDERHPVRDALFAVALSAGAYLLFARALDVTLPAGVVERWL